MSKVESNTREENLTKRASLTFLNTLLSQGIRFVTGFIVTPIIIRGVGAELYGAWLMIQQSMGYLALSDMRPMGTLKFTLAVTQHIEDHVAKKRQIGAAIILWFITLPPALLMGFLIVWFTPQLIRTQENYIFIIRLTMAIVVVNLVFDRIASLPGNVLRGLNLDYKRMGVNAGTILLVSVLSVPFIWIGWSLPGLAFAGFMGVIFTGVIQYWIVRKYIPWFGLALPTIKEFKEFTKTSVWLFISCFSFLLLNASDLLIVGYILGPTSAAIFGTTSAILKMSIEPVVQLLSSGNAGLSKLCGAREWGRLSKIRHELYITALALMTIIGGIVILLNKFFIKLWVGENFFGGDILNFLMVVATSGILFVRVDGIILDSILEFKKRAQVTLVAGFINLLLGVLLVKQFGLVGIAIASAIGKVGLAIYFNSTVSKHINIPLVDNSNTLKRMLLFMLVIFLGLMWFVPYMRISSWRNLVIYGTATIIIIPLIGWRFGVDNSGKFIINNRLKNIFG